MSLLYFHSPLPPAETGIADYAFETLARLKDHFDIVIVDEGDSRASADALLLPTMPVAVWRDLRMRSANGLDIYHLGNNRFHTGILQRALGHPGLCVIHDASLTGLLLSSPSLHPVFRRFPSTNSGCMPTDSSKPANVSTYSIGKIFYCVIWDWLPTARSVSWFIRNTSNR